MSHAREAQGGSPPSSPEQQRVVHVTTPPSTPSRSVSPPLSPQPLAQALDRTVALAVDATSPSLPPRRTSVPSLPAIPQRDATSHTPLLSAQPRLNVQDDSGLQRAAPGGLPKSRQAAQYLDLAAAVTSAPLPWAVPNAVRGVASGALWSTSAGFSAYNNQQDVRERHARGDSTGAMGWSNRAADVSSFIAGGSDATSSVFNYFGSAPGWAATASTVTAYASNAFWGVAGAVGFGQGIANLRDASKNKLASGLQVAGGLLNMAGAGFGAAAAQRQSADSSDPTAAYYGYASAAAWALGSAATIASNHLARRAENTRFAQDVENRG
jgi:hypothetical protein